MHVVQKKDEEGNVRQSRADESQINENKKVNDNYINDENRRVEDIRLLEGKGVFVDDLKANGNKLAYLGIIRSPYPHATILKIDFSMAEKDPDFIAGLTGKDLEDDTAPISTLPGVKQTNRRQLAIGKTRFVGEPVAAVVSKSKYALEDIIEAVNVEYEQIPAVLSIEDSKKARVRIFEDFPENVFFRNGAKKGDVSRAFSLSTHVIRTKAGIKRQAGAPIEPRSYLAEYDSERDLFNIEGTVQSAHRLQSYLSNELKMPASKFHVVVKDVGGGFGTKGAQSYPEPVLACILAQKTGYAIKATLTRTEDLLETAAGRDQYCEIELACDEHGKITGLRAKIEADVGVSGTLSASTRNTVQLLPGAYRIPNFDIEAVCYLTNKAPLGPVRGAGRPEASFFIERAIDTMAKHLQMDPLEFRRRNLILPDEMPYDNGAGSVYDSGNFPLLLDKVAPFLRDMQKWRDEINSKGKSSIVAGAGVCIEVEDTGAQLKESARVTIEGDGRISVVTGSSPHGQGLETSLAQLCSRTLGVRLHDVTVKYGDTSRINFGIGTFGSRSITTGGSAVVDVSRKAREEILRRTSELTGIDSKRISLESGQIVLMQDSKMGSRPSRTILMSLESLIEKTGQIEVYSEYTLSGVPFASGAHACLLTIDKETGGVRILKYVIADDCGKLINPVIVDGQLHGGVVHGLGGCLIEEIVYSGEGQLLTTNFLDYTIPSALEVPVEMGIIHLENPSLLTLNGAKGVGESGTIGAYPCVFSAINDALAQANCKIDLNVAPATQEAVLHALHQQGLL